MKWVGRMETRRMRVRREIVLTVENKKKKRMMMRMKVIKVPNLVVVLVVVVEDDRNIYIRHPLVIYLNYFFGSGPFIPD